MGPHLTDLNFQGTPGIIAAYLLDTPDGLAVVDPGPSSTLPALLAGVRDLGADASDLRHILLTHIHLDHAGSAGTLLALAPQARVYVHERGAKHLQAPERLLASATQIYGDFMDALWGEMRAVPMDQMTVLGGGETLRLGRLDVRPQYTPGHAVHHLAYHVGPDLFVGDVGGVRLQPSQTPRAPTPPPDIDLTAWQASIARLRDVPADALHLTHFGSFPQTATHWDGLLGTMSADAGVVFGALDAGETPPAAAQRFEAFLHAALTAEDASLPARFALASPAWMGAQGLIRAWTRQQARGGEPGQPAPA